MATVTINSHASQLTNVLIKDLGIIIPAAGAAPQAFSNQNELAVIQASRDLKTYLVDNAYGANASTLFIVEVGAAGQAQASNFLTSVAFSAAGSSYTPLVSDIDGNFQAGNKKIELLANPVADTDAVNLVTLKQYAQGLRSKGSVKALETVGDVDVATGGLAETIDDVAIDTDGYVVLLTAQTDPIENGLWVARVGAWTRPTNFAAGDDAVSSFVFVEQGTAYDNQGWLMITNGATIVDTDAQTWSQFSGAVSLTAGSGLTESPSGTFNVGAGNGITVNANDVAVSYSATATGLGSATAAGTADTASRGDHTHTHGNRGSDGAGSQHDADQVDVEATLLRIGAPGTAEAVMATINSNFGDGLYTGKNLIFSVAQAVPSTGTRYLKIGDVFSSSVALRMIRSGVITGASVQVSAADGVNNFDLSIEKNGVQVAVVSLPSGSSGNQSSGLSVAIAAGDLLSTALVRNGGSGASVFNNIVAIVEVSPA